MMMFLRTRLSPGAARRAADALVQVARDLALSRTLWIGVALIVAFWIIAALAPTVPQNDALRISRLSVAIAVTIGFGLSLVRILRARWPGMTGTIALGIFLSWLGTSGSGLWVLIYVLANKPRWMLDSNINGFFIYINMIGGFLHLVAYNAIDGRIPKAAWIRIGVAVGLVFGLTAWFVLSAPDATALADWLKPVFADAPDASN